MGEEYFNTDPVSQEIFELTMKLAEGFEFLEYTYTPSTISYDDLQKCQEMYGDTSLESVLAYLHYLHTQHTARYLELVEYWGEENIWVGPAEVFDKNGKNNPWQAQAFYVKYK